tara:strand:- start:2154 stop:2306 length:153 start_codon:yes stop_codon:yes gene_type:complete
VFESLEVLLSLSATDLFPIDTGTTQLYRENAKNIIMYFFIVLYPRISIEI